jgi:hypothetical protein
MQGMIKRLAWGEMQSVVGVALFGGSRKLAFVIALGKTFLLFWVGPSEGVYISLKRLSSKKQITKMLENLASRISAYVYTLTSRSDHAPVPNNQRPL